MVCGEGGGERDVTRRAGTLGNGRILAGVTHADVAPPLSGADVANSDDDDDDDDVAVADLAYGEDDVAHADVAEETPPWGHSVGASGIDLSRRIFCNRSLNMRSIEAVGFDMDYTLAQYRPEEFERMAHKETLKKLVENLGYPEEILHWQFDSRYMVRGLVIDKHRGNILKMDRHKYVKVAYHGFQKLSRGERERTYGLSREREAFEEPRFCHVDTLFGLPEAYLFAQLVEFQGGGERGKEEGFLQIYKDVRAAVDLCHRDGTLKLKVAKNPGKYIQKDEKIVPMLKLLRDSGRMTFLVTNSLWDYTDVVMNYLVGKCGTTEETKRDNEWLRLFDVVVTGSSKPSFFLSGSSIFQVDRASGLLRNTDGGVPVPQLGSAAPPDIENSDLCQVFQGGSVAHLHRHLNIKFGSQVLYVGDHIYGDILRSKKQLGWRTMLVVPELEREVKGLRITQGLRNDFHRLRQKRDALDDSIQRMEWRESHNGVRDEDPEEFRMKIKKLQSERDIARKGHRHAMRTIHKTFHRVWGQLLKTGCQSSRFAHQVERFACLYTSSVSNLCFYSPDKSFRTSEDFLPHDFHVIDFAETTTLPK